jgi:hypothetical protein
MYYPGILRTSKNKAFHYRIISAIIFIFSINISYFSIRNAPFQMQNLSFQLFFLSLSLLSLIILLLGVNSKIKIVYTYCIKYGFTFGFIGLILGCIQFYPSNVGPAFAAIIHAPAGVVLGFIFGAIWGIIKIRNIDNT